METSTIPWWQKILFAAFVGATGAVTGTVTNTAARDSETAAELREVRRDLREYSKDVEELRGVVDTLGKAVAEHVDGPGASKVFPGPVVQQQ